jgi:hypothetical protein
MMSDNHVHEVVQARYGAIASGQMASCCGSGGDCCGDTGANAQIYESSLLEGLPSEVVNISLGCGEPFRLLRSRQAKRC